MNSVATKNSTQIRQHQAIHAHMKYLINAVGRLDLQSWPHIAELNALKKRVKLYRWSLNDFKEAMQRDTELDKLAFLGNPLLNRIVKENQEILEQINSAIVLAENALEKKMIREELNVMLAKINLAANTICESIYLNITKEDELVKKPLNIG